MKNKQKGLLVAFIAMLVLSFSGAGLAALTTDSINGKGNKEATVEEILTAAIEDEYTAQGEYNAIIEKFGEKKPFTNIVRVEGMHIDSLLPLLEKYDVTVPKNDAAKQVTLPKNLQASYEAGIKAEKANIKLYQDFLKQGNVPDDVKVVLEKLIANSQNHLAAFEKAANGTIDSGNGQGNSQHNKGNGQGQNNNGNKMGNGMKQGGQGMNNHNSGDCMNQ